MGIRLRDWWPEFRLALQRWAFSKHRTNTIGRRPWARSDSGYQTGCDNTAGNATRSDSDSDIDTMGKSNKFDFTNRANFGVKLGESIARGLVKEAEKLKIGESRNRKKSKDSFGHSSAELKEHLVDLKAPGKALRDEGVLAMAGGLEAALSMRGTDATLQLEDLNISKNQLTTKSLVRLAPIIKLASYDLKTVDLSGNDITVTSDKEAEEWEEFLLSFRQCCKLRRLDLSNNMKLGARALEILARVHSREPQVDPLPPGGQASVISLIEEETPEELIQSKVDIANKNELFRAHYGKGLDYTVGNGKPTCIRRGLRSLPYMTLCRVNLTDSGALWLSYVLHDHYYPVQLIDENNATMASSPIATYRQDADTKGVSWDGNDESMGRDGSYLLMRTEAVRRLRMIDDNTMASSHTSLMAGSCESMYSGCVPERKPSVGRRDSRATQGSRRSSNLSILSTDAGDQEVSELDSARKKIQRHVIATEGATSVELWRAGLKVVTCSRLIFLMAPKKRTTYKGENRWKHDALSPLPALNVVCPTPTGTSTPPDLHFDTARVNDLQSDSRRSYAATLTPTSSGVPGEPEVAVTEVTNTTPKTIFASQRKGAFSEATDAPELVERWSSLIVRDRSPERFFSFQQHRIQKARQAITGEHGPYATAMSNPYRDESLACHLPHALIMRILGYVIEDREFGVLSGSQQRAAVAWGQRRETMSQGHEWVKKDESSQVWMLLDAVKCLEYESSE